MNTKSILAAFAALGCAVAAQADVSSSNIVGYNGKALITGQQMITASFIGVGSKLTFHVSDLKITGYQADPMWVENYGYGASFYVLDAFGRCLNEAGRSFAYGDNLVSDDPIEWEGGVWLDFEGNTVEPGADNDTELNAGDAIWFAGQPFTEGYQPRLQTSGQVINEDYAYPLITGQNGVGNGMSAPCYLSEITIEGYQEDPMWLENYGFGASFYVLDAYGRCLNEAGRSFAYGDNLVSDDPIEWEGGVWLDYQGNVVEAKGDNDLILQPGDGIWFAGQPFTPDEEPIAGKPAKYQQYLVFPTAVK